MRRLFIATITLTIVVFSFWPTLAQDNLLTNGGLEQGEFGAYQGKGRADLNVPVGWDIWLAQGPTDGFMNRGDKTFAFPHQGIGPEPVEGSTAMNISGGFVQFTAAVFQTVNVAEGTNLRAEAASQIKACTPPTNDDAFCGSDLNSGAQTRIGIDPDGGTDPNAPEIVWSAWLQPHDRWDRQAVEATSTGTQVTVFLYNTQPKPFNRNVVYWDDVKLTAEGGGGAAAPAAVAGPTATPRPQYVPFVNPQGARDDGSVVHTVQSGDTLDSIAVAYGLTRQDLIERNPTLGSTRFLSIGQQITIQAAQAEATPVPATTGDSNAEATPIPGGVATEEVAPLPDDAATEEVTEEAADAVINDDPKGLNTPEPTAEVTEEVAEAPTTDTEGEVNEDVANAVGDLLGALGGNAVPDENAAEEEATEEATADVTEEAVEEATEEPTAEPTTVAQAPVVEESVPSVDIVSSSVAVCVTLFEDMNQNRLREDGEVLLAGGTIAIQANGVEAASYTTDGESEPYCFNDLTAGEYVAIVTPPDGYGLTTPNQLRLPLTAGAALNIEFGALEGLEAPVIPAADTAPDLGNSADDVMPAEANSLTDNLMAISGIIVAALAGVVVLAGVGAAFLMRRGR